MTKQLTVLGLAEARGKVNSPAPAPPAAPSFSDLHLGSPSWSLSASEGSVGASGRIGFLVVAPLVMLGSSGQGLWLHLTLGLCLEVGEALCALLCLSSVHLPAVVPARKVLLLVVGYGKRQCIKVSYPEVILFSGGVSV